MAVRRRSMADQECLTFTCSGCQTSFRSLGALSGHVNDLGGLCNRAKIPYPIPPSFYQRPGEDIHGFYHHTSGYLYGKGETLLDKMQADVHERRREHVIYYPFADEGEWELGKFLLQHLPQSAIKEFLKLKWVSNNIYRGHQNNITFSSQKESGHLSGVLMS